MQSDGTYSVTLPMDRPMNGIATEDAGHAVAGVFSSPDEFIGKKVGFTGNKLTIQWYLDVLSRITGKVIKYNQIAPEQFAQLPFPPAADLAAMFVFYSEGHDNRDMTLTKCLNPSVRTFEQWATDNKQLWKDL